MILVSRTLQRFLRTKAVWGAAIILLALTRLGYLAYLSYHNHVAYHALKASQVDGSLISTLTYSGALARAELDSRTLWLLGRYYLYNNDPARASALLGEVVQSLSTDYQVHCDLLYAYDGAGKFEEFVREYERGQAMRRLLQEDIASGAELAGRANTLSNGGFDVQNPRSWELVLVNYIHFVDANLGKGDVEAIISGLALLREFFEGNLLVLSRAYRSCQVYREDMLCSGVSSDGLRKFRLRAWKDARLTGLIADAALQLYDQGLWTEEELLSLGRYLVWQHASEAETARFLNEVSMRGLSDSAWSELVEEMALRRELAAGEREGEALAMVEGNLLADPSTLFDDRQAEYLPLGQQRQRWHLEIYDTPPYGGGSYVGGIDEHACPEGESALRVDGLWLDESEEGPGAWAGFESNTFMLRAGAEYELGLAFRVSGLDSLAKVSVEFLPNDLFGPLQQPYRLVFAEGEWFFKQRLAVGGRDDVAAQLRVTYSGYGPLWLCEPRLVCKDCAQPTRVVRPVSDEYQVHLSEPSLECEDCKLISEYQEHRDLLYAYDEAGQYEEFVREYERGESVRRLLRELMRSESEAVDQLLRGVLALEGEQPLYGDMLLRGEFDVQDSRSRELVLVNYLRSADARLEEGDVETAVSRLGFIQGVLDKDIRDLLVLPRVYQVCQIQWEEALCSGVSSDELRKFRLQPWEDARLTGMIADLALQLYDQGLWTEMELLSVGRYLVWQHASEAETARFLDAVLGRGLSGTVWSELVEEMALRRELAAAVQEEEVAAVDNNLLADPSEWHLEVRDTPPYGGGSYVGGIDEQACPEGGSALRVDGLWLDESEGGPGAWAGFESNVFTLEPGVEYDLSFSFRVAHSHPYAWVHVKFLPSSVFGRRPYRPLFEDGKWSVVQRELTVQKRVSAKVLVMYRGYGPFWLCELRLVCKDCTQP